MSESVIHDVDFCGDTIAPGKQRITVYLDKTTAKRLRIAAATEDRSLSDIAEEAISAHANRDQESEVNGFLGALLNKADEQGERLAKLCAFTYRNKKKRPTKKTRKRHCAYLTNELHEFPCCYEPVGPSEIEIDHMDQTSDASFEGTWPTCTACNRAMNDPTERHNRRPRFIAYHDKYKKMHSEESRQLGLGIDG